MIGLARRLADSRHFQNVVLGVIVLTAIMVGLETSETLVERYGALFHWLDLVVQTIFVLEIGVRAAGLLAEAARVLPRRLERVRLRRGRGVPACPRPAPSPWWPGSPA